MKQRTDLPDHLLTVEETANVINTSPITRTIPLDTVWRDLLNHIVVPHHRHALGRLAAYCTVMEIPPKAVDTTTLLGLHAALEAEELVKSPRTIVGHTISSWNRSHRSLEQWPRVVLESPFPHLRIIDDELWLRVKQRQEKTRSRIIKGPGNIRSEKARRPRYLLSGLIKCGACGGGFSMNGANRYACSTAHNKGTCSNRLSIRRDDLEARVVDGLRKELMHPDLVKAFIDEFHSEANRLAADRDFDRDRLVRNMERTNRDLKRIVQAIKDGIPALTLKDELMGLEERKLELEQMVSKAPAPVPRLHPRLADLYRRKVDDLHDALNREDTRAEASEAIRSLIDEIRLVPEKGELKVELFGELAALVGLANESPRSDDRGLQVTLVAGARCQPFRTPVSAFVLIPG